ncbi:MAG: Uma2 family endonuclease, partial [Limnospira sp. PMC 289.06]|nr:Uma2 family endonuclease [Limnospira sp. PMC 289.06]
MNCDEKLLTMTIAQSSEQGITTLPDHTQLPDSDGTFVKNFR